MIVKHLYLYNGKVIHLCQIGSLPFTYLGLPLRITKPRLEDFEAMVSRVERRMISVRDVIPTPDLRIGTGSARSEARPDRGRLPLMAVGPLSRSAI
jgi:hypothetical protein